jgi:hypothetical protein
VIKLNGWRIVNSVFVRHKIVHIRACLSPHADDKVEASFLENGCTQGSVHISYLCTFSAKNQHSKAASALVFRQKGHNLMGPME